MPVPELSRWPSGPATLTWTPVLIMRSARASGPMMVRSGPLPSSTVTPRPSVSWSGDAVTVPLTETRRPSSVSPAAPVSIGSAGGSETSDPRMRSDSEIRSVRWPNRLATSPSTLTAEPAGHDPTTMASRYSAMPPEPSWMKPARPLSTAPSGVVSTPSIVTTAPSARALATAIVIDDGVGIGVGTGVGIGVGTGVAIGVWTGVGIGTAVAVTLGTGVGVEVGVGVAVAAGDDDATGVAVGKAVASGFGTGG